MNELGLVSDRGSFFIEKRFLAASPLDERKMKGCRDVAFAAVTA
jgi:hypothetical protein